MSKNRGIVGAKIDRGTKERAAEALAAMGLTVSDAIRMFLARVAEERRLPFEVRAPNAATLAAIKELEGGGGQRFANFREMMADLYAGN